MKVKKIVSTILVAIMIIATTGTVRMAGGNNGAEQSFGLEIQAIAASQGADLYLTVNGNGVPVPEQLKHVQVKIYSADGKLQGTDNYNNVPSPGGIAVINLPEAGLGCRVEAQVNTQTDESVNTEVVCAETIVTEFGVNSGNVVVSDFQGYGAQMNMHLYTALNDPARGFVGNEPPKEVENLEAKVIDIKPGLSRIFLSPVNFDPGNENRQESFIKTVELAQKAGAIVNVTWWFIERAAGDNPVQQQILMEENMRQFADTLIDLIKNRGLTAVQQITIQNEVNTSWVKPELYEQYYRLLDTYLKEAGIRDKIKFVGGDLVYNNQVTWYNYMADHMGDVLDGWSCHIYWNYWDTAYMLQRLSDVKGIYESISAEKRKPLYITEYGVRGIKTDPITKKPIMDSNPYRGGALTSTLAGYYEDGTPIAQTQISAFEHAWFNMLSVDMGFSGLSKWDMYRAQYDFTYQDYSLVGYLFNPAPVEDRWPLRPAYYMQWLMANTTGVGWQVVGYRGASGSKLVTPFRSPSGEWTVFALSTDRAAASFSISGLPANTDFNILVWNSDGSGKVTNAGSVNTGETGTAVFNAPAGSLVALTTVSTGM